MHQKNCTLNTRARGKSPQILFEDADIKKAIPFVEGSCRMQVKHVLHLQGFWFKTQFTQKLRIY